VAVGESFILSDDRLLARRSRYALLFRSLHSLEIVDCRRASGINPPLLSLTRALHSVSGTGLALEKVNRVRTLTRFTTLAHSPLAQGKEVRSGSPLFFSRREIRRVLASWVGRVPGGGQGRSK